MLKAFYIPNATPKSILCIHVVPRKVPEDRELYVHHLLLPAVINGPFQLLPFCSLSDRSQGFNLTGYPCCLSATEQSHIILPDTNTHWYSWFLRIYVVSYLCQVCCWCFSWIISMKNLPNRIFIWHSRWWKNRTVVNLFVESSNHRCRMMMTITKCYI